MVKKSMYVDDSFLSLNFSLLLDLHYAALNTALDVTRFLEKAELEGKSKPHLLKAIPMVCRTVSRL